MQKIDGFKINRLRLSGFSCFKKETEFSLDEVTMVFGSNHAGKSSIAHAIAFAVTGCTFYGEQKTIDRFYNEDNPDIFVGLELTDGSGASHELIRRRKEDKMSVSFDGYSVRQKDLNELFGERDVFLSIFNPLYFIEVLGEDGKGLLELFLPPVSHEQVLEGLSDYNKEVLMNENLISPDIYLSSQRDKIRGMEKEITEFQAKKSFLLSQRQENAAKLKNLQADIKTIEGRITELSRLKPSENLIKQLQEKITALSLQYDEMIAESASQARTDEIDTEISKLELAVEHTQRKIYESKYISEFAKVKADFEAAHGEHNKLSSLVKEIHAGSVCSGCFRTITEDEVEAVKASFIEKLNEIMYKGKACQTQFKKLKGLDEKAKAVFEKFIADDTVKLQTSLNALKEQREKIFQEHEVVVASSKKEIEKIQAQIQKYEEEMQLGDLTLKQYQELEGLEQEYRKKTAEFEALQKLYKAEQVNEFTQQIECLQAEITSAKEKVFAAAEYAAKRAEITFENLCTEHVKIILCKVLKTTGEVKNVFQFTYNDRDYRRLSRSEKMLAGMEVSELIKKLTGRTYPMFIDDAESISNIPRPRVQTVLSVVKAKTPLTVIPRGQTVSLEKAS